MRTESNRQQWCLAAGGFFGFLVPYVLQKFVFHSQYLQAVLPVCLGLCLGWPEQVCSEVWKTDLPQLAQFQA